MEKTIFTNMCLIVEGTKALVIQREGTDWPGITFPGGEVKEGESFTDAMIREIKEDTGLTVSSLRLAGIRDWCADDTRHTVLMYTTEKFTGEPVSSGEGEVFWSEIEDLKNMPLANDMEDMMDVFLKEDISEFFYRYDGDKWQKELK